MVTHELDIAAYCKRIVVMRDGQIVSDIFNYKRRLARDELNSLKEIPGTERLNRVSWYQAAAGKQQSSRLPASVASHCR